MGIDIRPARELARLSAARTLTRVLPGYSLRPMPVAPLSPEGRLRVPRVRAVADYLGSVLAGEMAADTDRGAERGNA